jgi:hypothetical protein
MYLPGQILQSIERYRGGDLDTVVGDNHSAAAHRLQRTPARPLLQVL